MALGILALGNLAKLVFLLLGVSMWFWSVSLAKRKSSCIRDWTIFFVPSLEFFVKYLLKIGHSLIFRLGKRKIIIQVARFLAVIIFVSVSKVGLRETLKHQIRFIDSKHPEHDKKTFNCDHCTKSFIFKASLQKHLENQRTMARNRDKKINLGLMEKNRRKKYDEH